jgi:predicted pyridoxine 5'-phosphate oxidase superfamily flavin-nucleotide-binding protein
MPNAHDPAAEAFALHRDIGILGIDFATRRRNRANGRIVGRDAGGIRVAVSQSFGNCPQYIQTRAPAPRAVVQTAREDFEGLDDAARALIASSDTFFIASRSRAGIGVAGGLDMSHRGGRPGFVGVHGDTLAIPDFRGNRYYNTLGNLLGDPRAGLIFVDFASGDILQLQGTVTIDWHPDGGPAGTERLWRLKVERAWRRRGAFPFAWTFGDYAPTTLRTGVW